MSKASLKHLISGSELAVSLSTDHAGFVRSVPAKDVWLYETFQDSGEVVIDGETSDDNIRLGDVVDRDPVMWDECEPGTAVVVSTDSGFVEAKLVQAEDERLEIEIKGKEIWVGEEYVSLG